jgi:hypothetical protein
MHELYRLIQQLTEDTPRSNPRVPTHLPARCKSDGKEWTSTMLSLSENGCLVRSPEPLSLGRRLELSFELPRSGGSSSRPRPRISCCPTWALSSTRRARAIARRSRRSSRIRFSRRRRAFGARRDALASLAFPPY